MKNKQYVKTLQELADTSLARNGEYYQYSDEALIDVTVIFNEVFLSKMFDFKKDKLPEKEMYAIATESGTALRKLIIKYTGINMHKAVKTKLSDNKKKDVKRKTK